MSCVLSSLFAHALHAANGGSAAPEQVMKKVSIAATRGPEELGDIPATVTVKTDADLERELARDIKDLTRYEPGVSVANAGTRFGLAGFNIRGIEGNRIAMRIDGIRMNDAFAIGSFADARRNLVDLDLLKSVEIVRGPASALYGSDAIGGVVSFVTKDPQDLLSDNAARSSHASRIKSSYRSDSDAWALGGLYALGNDTAGALLSYRRGEGQAMENRGSIGTADNTRTQANPQSMTNDSVLAKFTLKPNARHTLRAAVSYDRDRDETQVWSAQGRGAGAFANIFVLNLDGADQQERQRVSLDHAAQLATLPFDELEWRAYWQTTEVTQRSSETRHTVSSGPTSTVLRERLFSFEQRLTGVEALARKRFALGDTEHLLTYGIEAVRTDTRQVRDGVQTTPATGAITANIAPDHFPVRDFPITETRQYAFYAQDQLALSGALLVTPGVRVDYYALQPQIDAIFAADNPGVAVADLKETSVSPKLGAIWHFAPQYSLYGNYARGFRAPPYNDVNIGFTNLAFGYTAIANPNLKSETSDGYEAGVRGELARGYFSVAAFYNDYRYFINSLTFVGMQGGLQVFQSQNLSKAKIYGTEVRAGAHLFNRIKLRSSIAYARGSGNSAGQPTQPINSVDPLKGVLGIAYRLSTTWNLELIGTAVARHEHVNQTTPQFTPGGYFLLDLLAQAQFANHVDFNVGIFNLTDKFYWEWSDVRGLPPNSPTLDRATRPGINAGANLVVRF